MYSRPLRPGSIEATDSPELASPHWLVFPAFAAGLH